MKNHDTLARRLAIILTRLNTGEKMHLKELSNEFNVSERTLQRDFNERFAYLPIQRHGIYYFLDPKFLGRQTNNQISLLLSNMGINTFFSGNSYLSNGILNNKDIPAFLFKNPIIENISSHSLIFDDLIISIKLKKDIIINCDGIIITNFQPYRLVNDCGLWYLVGVHDNLIISLRISKITKIIQSNNKYNYDQSVDEYISTHNFNPESFSLIECSILVKSNISEEFLTENSNDDFNLLKKLESGDLIINFKTNNIRQFLRKIKAWVPDIEVISPCWVKQRLDAELKEYLNSIH